MVAPVAGHYRATALSGSRERAAIERHLVHVAVTPRVGFKPRQVIARLEIDNAAPGIQPVDADLAIDIAVFGPHDSFRHARGQQFHRQFIASDTEMHSQQQIELLAREHQLALCGGPFSERLGIRSVDMARFRIDRTADSVFLVETLAPFENQRVGRAAEEIRRAVRIGDQSDPFSVKVQRLFDVD